MKKPIILRKRFIPNETVDISGDELLYRDDEVLITKWKAIKPRADLSGGLSCTFLEKGIKVSRFYDNSGSFIYWYCDILDTDYDKGTDRYVLVDLLVDVKIKPDGQVEILDIGELADALEQEIITKEQSIRSLRKLNILLESIYSGNFPPEKFKKFLEEYGKEDI